MNLWKKKSGPFRSYATHIKALLQFNKILAPLIECIDTWQKMVATYGCAVPLGGARINFYNAACKSSQRGINFVWVDIF
ncbi:hypothetical protein HZB04_03075 [Candidatus Wolfebacteria bacterium]|nr:hypothetical protein [Candidatus Wolfebacteria bacterium]